MQHRKYRPTGPTSRKAVATCDQGTAPPKRETATASDREVIKKRNTDLFQSVRPHVYRVLFPIAPVQDDRRAARASLLAVLTSKVRPNVTAKLPHLVTVLSEGEQLPSQVEARLAIEDALARCFENCEIDLSVGENVLNREQEDTLARHVRSAAAREDGKEGKGAAEPVADGAAAMDVSESPDLPSEHTTVNGGGAVTPAADGAAKVVDPTLLQSGGGWIWFAPLVLFFTPEQGARVYTDTWMGNWFGGKYGRPLGFYLGTYLMLGLVYGGLTFLRATTFLFFCVRSAVSPHNRRAAS